MMINIQKIFLSNKRKIKNISIDSYQPKIEDNKMTSLKSIKNYLNFIEIKIIVKFLNKLFINFNLINWVVSELNL